MIVPHTGVSAPLRASRARPNMSRRDATDAVAFLTAVRDALVHWERSRTIENALYRVLRGR